VPADSPRRWGWHCLTDDWARRLVATAELPPGALVLDLGAGTGALTCALVEAGARVVAYELHPGRLAVLQDRFAGAPVQVVCADVADLRLPRRPFYVVANPPFACTGPVLRRLLSARSQLAGACVVLQRSTAKRWSRGEVAGSSRWQRRFEVDVALLVPRSAFVQRPQVDVAVLSVKPRWAGSRTSTAPDGRTERRHPPSTSRIGYRP